MVHQIDSLYFNSNNNKNGLLKTIYYVTLED